jgi:hypothetical protein
VSWSHLRTILWLRWRLTLNQWRRSGGVGQVLSIFVIAALVVLAVGGSIAGFAGGALGLATARSPVVMLVWDAVVAVFLFLWLIGLLSEIQRSESLDLSRLLHLPIALKDVFLVNYAASHFNLSFIVAAPIIMGLSLGLALGRGPIMLLLLPLALSFLFMITAWTYCLRGWLISLMVNQRRRRAIIVSLTAGFILLAQMPNLYFNVMLKRPGSRSANGALAQRNKELPDGWIQAHRWVPLLWLPHGAMHLASGTAWPALWGSLAAFAIGSLGLRRAYTATMRFYQGQARVGAIAVRPANAPLRQENRNLIERTLPLLPEDSGTLALAAFRSMSRAPEVKMALVTSFIMLIVFAALMFSGGARKIPEAAKPFIATGSVSFVFLSMLQLMFNQFGVDRDGFRSLVLLPVRRDHILLGKNLSYLPIAIGVGTIFLILLSCAGRIPLMAGFAAFLQMLTAFCLVSVIGNALSIVVPYRVAAGALKPTKVSAKTTLLIFASHLCFPLAMLPIFLPAGLAFLCESMGWMPWLPINLIFSMVLLMATAAVYWGTLGYFGALLQRRERTILHAVTQEVE